MREAIGGSVLFMIILGFIAVYIVFIRLLYCQCNYFTKIVQADSKNKFKSKKQIPHSFERGIYFYLLVAFSPPSVSING